MSENGLRDTASIGYRSEGDKGRLAFAFQRNFLEMLVTQLPTGPGYITCVSDWITPTKFLPLDLEKIKLNFKTNLVEGDGRSLGFFFSDSPMLRFFWLSFRKPMTYTAPFCQQK